MRNKSVLQRSCWKWKNDNIPSQRREEDQCSSNMNFSTHPGTLPSVFTFGFLLYGSLEPEQKLVLKFSGTTSTSRYGTINPAGLHEPLAFRAFSPPGGSHEFMLMCTHDNFMRVQKTTHFQTISPLRLFLGIKPTTWRSISNYLGEGVSKMGFALMIRFCCWLSVELLKEKLWAAALECMVGVGGGSDIIID